MNGVAMRFLFLKQRTLLFVNYMNSNHSNMKFNLILKARGFLLFGDVKIRRTANDFITSVFCKATFSGVFTKFDSLIFRYISRVYFGASPFVHTYKLFMLNWSNAELLLTHYMSVLPSCRNRSIHFHSKSVDWFQYEVTVAFKELSVAGTLFPPLGNVKTFLNKLYIPRKSNFDVPKYNILVFLLYLGKFSMNLKALLYK